ncbi:hypothetical protein N7530_008462 [Penicillium desertorum]|uniref:Uncharacterized protein n=1 Tax=Penicillium desertorum TaxID=1303715 RepID=A0A9W9WP49_9EURO|nr:hypothetical protein N7530_008462 [Penicillium desertorum]
MCASNASSSCLSEQHGWSCVDQMRCVGYQSSALMSLDSQGRRASRTRFGAAFRAQQLDLGLVLDESVFDIYLSSLASLDSLCVFTCLCFANVCLSILLLIEIRETHCRYSSSGWICLLLPSGIWTQSYLLAPPERSTIAKSGGSNLDIPKTEGWEGAASVPFKSHC